MIKLEVSFLKGGLVDFNVDEGIYEITGLLDKWLEFLNETPTDLETLSSTTT